MLTLMTGFSKFERPVKQRKRKHRTQTQKDRDKKEDEETNQLLRQISEELRKGVSPEDLSGIRDILKHGIPGGD